MAVGYVKIHRQLADNDLWTGEKFSRGQAWVDLIMLANWAAGHVRIRGVKINLKRGQLAGSSTFLSARWQWSRGKVARFLKDLENEHQIEQQITNVTSIITVTNYDAFQQTEQQTEQQTDSRRTANRTANGHTKEETNNNQRRNEEQSKSTGDVEDIPEIDVERELVATWNSAKGVKKTAKATLTQSRRSALRTRLKDRDWDWRVGIAKFPLPVQQSDPNGWQPTIDWFLKPDSVTAILEGKYDFDKRSPRKAGRQVGGGEHYDPNAIHSPL